MKKIILLSFFLLCCFVGIRAVPAYRGAIHAKQSDGTVITFYLQGDEHCHQCVSADGYPLMQDEQGTYRYASQTSDMKMSVAGSPIAHNPALRSAEETAYLKTVKPASELKKTEISFQSVSTSNGARKSMMKVQTQASRFQIGNFPTTGTIHALVLLVQFQDATFTLSKDFHQRMMNEKGFSDDGATGSAHDYFDAQSGGRFDPQFDVVGPVTLDHSESYYGADDTFKGNDYNAGYMISDACQKAQNMGVDFSKYDYDNDGSVDMVYVIYAGYGQNAGAPSTTIWPHKYSLSELNISLQLNGKTIDTYACSAELFGNSGTSSAGVGTVCHEFGHVLGFADHYNTTNSQEYKLGSYDIMDYGSYNNNSHTPPSYNAFERMTLGWMTPDELTKPADEVTLANIATDNKAYILTTANEDEFFLLENRQMTGWDAYLPASGLMITHVDYVKSLWQSNTVNNVTAHPHFYLVNADNEAGYNVLLNNESENNDLYPIAKNNRFADNSTPASITWTGATLDKWVTNIKNAASVVSFKFMANHLPEPSDVAAEELTDNGFTATWDKVSKATSYSINLYKLAFRSAQKQALREDFSKMTSGTVNAPDGTDIAGSLDTYMQTAGWTGSQVYQAGGWCRIGSQSAAGSLTLPALNCSRYDNEFAVVVNVKSVQGLTPVFSISANGQTAKHRLTSTARTYLYQFTGGMSKTYITLATSAERAFIDSIVVVRGNGATLYPDAKVITVTGTPEIVETDVKDTDFMHVDTVAVTGVTTNSYVFTGLEAHTYYAFDVKALCSYAQSGFCREHVVYTDATSGITNAGMNAGATLPAELIYRADGCRVTSMSQSGLYILKRGDKVMKVLKK